MITLKRCGPGALLIRWSDDDDAAARRGVAAVARALEKARPEGLSDWTPAYQSLLLIGAVDPLAAWWRANAARLARVAAKPSAAGVRIEAPVDYSGPDLDRVAAHAGLSRDEVVARHSAPDYPVRCLGFAPGFAYLSGLDPKLRIDRLANPRTRVLPGSVGIGGDQTGVYPLPTPGGWNIIGTTSFQFFRPGASGPDAMFPVRAGDFVKFVPQPGAAEGIDRKAPEQAWCAGGKRPALRVAALGAGMLVVDGGRPGWRRFGVPAGGPADGLAAAAANRLMGNRENAPTLELCFHGQSLVATDHVELALTGADLGAVVRRAGSLRLEPVEGWRTFALRPGDLLEFRRNESGVFAYLAAPGGWLSPSWLGSQSGYARAQLGGAPGPGTILETAGDPAGLRPGIGARRTPWTEIRDYRETPPIRVWPGLHWDRFNRDAQRGLTAGSWTVNPQSDRMGWRLEGQPLADLGQQLWSEPLIPGAVQAPPNGQLVVAMPDGPTVGGYPQIAQVAPEDLPWLAQARPGQRVRFARSEASEALGLWAPPL